MAGRFLSGNLFFEWFHSQKQVYVLRRDCDACDRWRALVSFPRNKQSCSSSVRFCQLNRRRSCNNFFIWPPSDRMSWALFLAHNLYARNAANYSGLRNLASKAFVQQRCLPDSCLFGKEQCSFKLIEWMNGNSEEKHARGTRRNHQRAHLLTAWNLPTGKSPAGEFCPINCGKIQENCFFYKPK